MRKALARSGLGAGLFHDLRYRPDGTPNPDFILNQPEYRRARILVAGPNLGLGSSQAHAARALDDFGIRCVISSRIDDRFHTHCADAGVLPVILEQSMVDELMADAMVPQKALMTIDLESEEIVRAGGQTVRFHVPSPVRDRLLQAPARSIRPCHMPPRPNPSRQNAKSRCLRSEDRHTAGDAMRLGTYAKAGEREWRAALFHTDHEIVDLADALAASADGRASLLRCPIRPTFCPGLHRRARLLAARIAKALAADQLDVARIRLATVRHGPPVPNPGKFIAIGRNYMNHVREGQRIWAARGKVVEVPTFPAAFAKFASAITAHGDAHRGARRCPSTSTTSSSSRSSSDGPRIACPSSKPPVCSRLHHLQ
jgi:3-isopropylmalate/(R)-2-methylmalate dehydratase small subunit